MKLIKMFENRKPHHHKTAAALFFQSKKIFLPRFVARPGEQTAGDGSLEAVVLLLSEASGSLTLAGRLREARPGQRPEGWTRIGGAAGQATL